MSYPFVIWTMQRTGGTALTTLLMDMSEHRSAEHEPFNWARKTPRQFWPVSDAFNRTQDAPALAAALGEIFDQRYLIKHCFELPAMPFNLHLMAAMKPPYRHVQLVRRDEAARLVSKFIADAQGTWFTDYARRVFAEITDGERELGPLPIEQMVRHFQHCRDAARVIEDALSRSPLPCRQIFYEDLYVGDRETRLGHMTALLDFLGFTAAEIADNRSRIEQTVFDSGQDTQAVAPLVPNLAAATQALVAAGCPAPPRGRRPRPGGARARIAGEFLRLAEIHAARGPYLEIGGSGAEPILWNAAFSGAERHVVGGNPPALDGVTVHDGDPNDLRPLFADESFRTVVWNGAMAHDRYFWRTAEEAKRVLTPGGVLMLAVPGFARSADRAGLRVVGPKGNPVPDATATYRVHDSPDYWRISPQAMRSVLLDGLEVREVRVSMTPPRIFGVGVKPG